MPAKIDKLSFTMTTDQLTNLLRKIKDLVAIDTRIFMKIDDQSILLFSFVGDSFKNIHAFKNYIFDTKNIMNISSKITEPIIFVAKDGKKLYRTLDNLIDYKDDINGEIFLNDENYVNLISFDNNQLKIKIIGSDISIGKDISIEDVNFLMDIKKSLFNFEINSTQFAKIKRMSLIENELNSVLYIHIEEKKLSIGETKWHLNLCDMDQENVTLAFPKKYFNTINPSESIKMYVFDNFILCKYDEYNLMILMETTI